MRRLFRGGATARLSISECLPFRACARDNLFARTRETDTLAMLDASDTPTLDTSPASDSVLESRQLIERLQAELKFKQTKIEALNFEIARLKRWRFGSSAESLEATTQAVLFNAILADTALEDSAAKQANKPPPAAPAVKGNSVRQALPAKLPRVDRHSTSGPPTAPAAKPSSASTKRSASNSTACRPSSSCCATSAANTPAPAARRSRPRPCPRR